jgi:protein TonB
MEKCALPLLINKHIIMERQTLLHADYLDIIYDNRNKNYGGYELRRNYGRRVAKGAGFMLLCVGILSGYSFIGKENASNATVIPHEVVTIITEIKPPIIEPKVIPPTPPPPPAQPQVKTAKYVNPKIEPDDNVKPDDHMPPNKDLNNTQIGTANTDGPATTTSVVVNTTKTEGPGDVVINDTKPSLPLVWVDQMPQFDGDMENYLSRHIHYPELARENGINGKVIIRFVVNEDGSVSNATVERGIGGGCDEEALRIIRSMPKWKAGKQNGVPVKVFFMLPIKFTLNP